MIEKGVRTCTQVEELLALERRRIPVCIAPFPFLGLLLSHSFSCRCVVFQHEAQSEMILYDGLAAVGRLVFRLEKLMLDGLDGLERGVFPPGID